jgi:ribonucleotide monophosphatase NagD (HAD superfamily)
MNVFVFGSGDDDESYCTSAGWTLTSIEKAHLILARGTFTINDGSTVIHKMEDEMEYWKVMEESMIVAAKKKLPMLVANPDKIRPDEGLPPMPGAIGDAYERFLWTTNCAPVGDMTEVAARDYVKRIGKPFQEVYDIALRGSDPSRAIMIGDALETDVTGASNAGVDSMWVVQDGIHAEDVNEKSAEGVIAGFNGNSEFTYAYGKRVMPNYVTDHFRW